jgi:hypothetical protein
MQHSHELTRIAYSQTACREAPKSQTIMPSARWLASLDVHNHTYPTCTLSSALRPEHAVMQ